ncbi:hypothetical protein N499_0855A, partial [Wolbachia pipientis wVitA]
MHLKAAKLQCLRLKKRQ